MAGWLAKERIIAPAGFNRWRVPPASIAIHLCIGSVYAWSVFNPPLTRLLGGVTSAADDWSLPSVVNVFTIAIVCLGLSAAVAGPWLERVGPRMVGTVSALCWGGGYLLAAAGVHWHQLWLLYLGYGVIGGIGLGLGYVSPVSTLIKWFPDRRGMATGMAIMGFGGGAIVGTPLKETLLQAYFQPPVYLGTVDQLDITTDQGRQFVHHNSQRQEVVVVTSQELRSVPGELKPGVYLVGTGSVGVTQTFITLGLGYMCVMLIAAFSYRLPAAGWVPAGWQPSANTGAAGAMITTHTVTINEALKTPQFYLLWIVLCCNVTAGIGVLGVAKTMISEIFGTTLPHIVTNTFASTFVLMTSVFNMVGRFGWATASDIIGRRRIYMLFFAAGTLLYLLIPLTALQVSTTRNSLWLWLFYVIAMLIFTMYGGGFATIPAYIADLFGTKFVGGIHGRLLTAWSTAGVLGPWLIATLRQREIGASVRHLASLVSPAEFEARFHAPLSQLDDLIAKNTVSIAKLMELVPEGTINPTSGLYNSTMYLMAGFLVVGFIANALVKPVDPKHHLQESA